MVFINVAGSQHTCMCSKVVVATQLLASPLAMEVSIISTACINYIQTQTKILNLLYLTCIVLNTDMRTRFMGVELFYSRNGLRLGPAACMFSLPGIYCRN